MNYRISLVALLVLGTLASGLAFAGPDKKANREREALRRAQQQVQQMQGQVATLEQDKDRMSQELAASTKSAKTAGGKAARLARDLKQEKEQREALAKELEAAKQDLASARERLGQAEARLADTGKNLNETRQTLAVIEAEKKKLEGIKALREREIALCEDKNKDLYQIGRDLMVRYEKKSCGDALAQKEPFAGLRQVEVENLLEEYRDKLDAQKLIKPPGG